MSKRQTFSWLVVACVVAAALGVAQAAKPSYDVEAKRQADAELAEAMADLAAGFQEWRAAHQVAFSSREQELAAFELWSARVVEWHEHNQQPGISFFMKMNARMAIDYAARQSGAMEWQAASLQRRSLQATRKATGLTRPKTALQSSPFRSLSLKDTSCPPSLDWRDQGVLTPVKNQGQCGSCWTFSSTGAIEAAVAIATGQLPSLSEQQLVDCVTASHGCNGGWMGDAFSYVQSSGGITRESTYPYTASQGACQQELADQDVAAQVAGYTDLPAGDEGALKSALCNGPVAIALTGGSKAFQGYGGGVIEAGTDCDSSEVDHAVLAIGFGQDEGGDFWIIRNSWGQGWGEGGHVRIRMGANVCRVVSFSPTVPQVAGGDVPPPPNPPPPPPAPGPAPPGCTSTHTVQPGDTLYEIAIANGLTLPQVVAANPQIENPDMIQVGDVINLPCTASFAASPLTCAATVTVKAGDSFWTIATKNKVTPQALQNANPQVSNPALIYPGTRLNVPPCQLKQSVKSSASARSQCKRVSYVVKKGDFLYKVANQFSCTVGDVLTLNPAVAKGARLQPGKTITVLSCPLAARSRSAFLNPVHLVAGAKMQQPARG